MEWRKRRYSVFGVDMLEVWCAVGASGEEGREEMGILRVTGF